jgi:hypothetical protein
MTMDSHADHCFVAIPSGRTPEERLFYEGWTNEVILPALRDDFNVQVAAASAEPTSITLDIFEHLLSDQVAVFDLGGADASQPANPNVMYELGIRHAFRLPSVILAWENQPLPFDVGNQRAVKVDRVPYHFERARQKIREFADSARKGKFYDPLESLANRAILKTEGEKNVVIQTIADELKNLSARIDSLQPMLRYSDAPAYTTGFVNEHYVVDHITPYPSNVIRTGGVGATGVVVNEANFRTRPQRVNPGEPFPSPPESQKKKR